MLLKRFDSTIESGDERIYGNKDFKQFGPRILLVNNKINLYGYLFEGEYHGTYMGTFNDYKCYYINDRLNGIIQYSYRYNKCKANIKSYFLNDN